MANLIIKILTALLVVYYTLINVDGYNAIVSILIALCVSFIVEIFGKKVRIIAFSIYFLLSLLYNPLYYTYPIVIQASIKLPIYSMILPILCQLIIGRIDFGIIIFCVFSYYSTKLENLVSYYKRMILDKEDILSLSQKEQKLKEEIILNNAEKQTEIEILSERNRISREIHDSVGHTISGAILQTEVMRIGADDDLNRQIDSLQDNLKKGMMDIRSSLHQIHEKSLDLNLAIDKLAKASVKPKIEINFKSTSNFTYEFKSEVISVIKEVITNTIKHSQASLLKISFIEMPKHISLIIIDNGGLTDNSDLLCEIKAPKINEYDKGIGFLSFKDFANRYEGRFFYEYKDGLELRFLLNKTSCIVEN